MRRKKTLTLIKRLCIAIPRDVILDSEKCGVNLFMRRYEYPVGSASCRLGVGNSWFEYDI